MAPAIRMQLLIENDVDARITSRGHCNVVPYSCRSGVCFGPVFGMGCWRFSKVTPLLGRLGGGAGQVPPDELDFFAGDIPHGLQQHLMQDTRRPVVVAVRRYERLHDALRSASAASRKRSTSACDNCFEGFDLAVATPFRVVPPKIIFLLLNPTVKRPGNK